MGPLRPGLGLGRTGLPHLGLLGEVGLGLPRLPLSLLILLPLRLLLLPLLQRLLPLLLFFFLPLQLLLELGAGL